MPLKTLFYRHFLVAQCLVPPYVPVAFTSDQEVIRQAFITRVGSPNPDPVLATLGRADLFLRLLTAKMLRGIPAPVPFTIPEYCASTDSLRKHRFLELVDPDPFSFFYRDTYYDPIRRIVVPVKAMANNFMVKSDEVQVGHRAFSHHSDFKEVQPRAITVPSDEYTLYLSLWLAPLVLLIKQRLIDKWPMFAMAAGMSSLDLGSWYTQHRRRYGAQGDQSKCDKHMVELLLRSLSQFIYDEFAWPDWVAGILNSFLSAEIRTELDGERVSYDLIGQILSGTPETSVFTTWIIMSMTLFAVVEAKFPTWDASTFDGAFDWLVDHVSYAGMGDDGLLFMDDPLPPSIPQTFLECGYEMKFTALEQELDLKFCSGIFFRASELITYQSGYYNCERTSYFFHATAPDRAYIKLAYLLVGKYDRLYRDITNAVEMGSLPPAVDRQLLGFLKLKVRSYRFTLGRLPGFDLLFEFLYRQTKDAHFTDRDLALHARGQVYNFLGVDIPIVVDEQYYHALMYRHYGITYQDVLDFKSAVSNLVTLRCYFVSEFTNKLLLVNC